MDGGVWERVSASFAQHSREDVWRPSHMTQNVMHACLCHMTSCTFQGGTVPCLQLQEQEGSCTLQEVPRENIARYW